MAETIGSLIIMVMFTVLLAFVGYIIISGENEDAKKRKNK